MNRRINRRYQTPLRPDFTHFLIEEQGLSDRQKKVVYQLRSKTQDSQWHYQDAGMSKDEFEETVKDLNDYYWALLVDMAFEFYKLKKDKRGTVQDMKILENIGEKRYNTMNTPYFNNFMPQPGQFGMPQMQAPTQQMNQIQFVNGIESAKAFTLGPNQSVILMDSNKPVFYQKQADASGFCTIKAYSFQEVKEDQPEDKYLTKAEFKEWLSKVEQNARGGNRHESTTSK